MLGPHVVLISAPRDDRKRALLVKVIQRVIPPMKGSKQFLSQSP